MTPPIKTFPSDRTPCSHRAGSRHLSLEPSFPSIAGFFWAGDGEGEGEEEDIKFLL